MDNSKHSKMRRKVLRTMVAGGTLAAGGAALPSLVRAQSDTVRVGFPVPLTGAFAAEAQAVVRGAELAIKEFNDAGGLNGRKAELLVRDDKLNPQEAATRTIELIDKDKAHFIVGSVSSAVQLSVNNVTKQRKVIYNSISQSDTINEAKDWSRSTFHECLNPHMTAGAVARYAIPKMGKRVVFLTADYAYGHEMVRGFQTAGKALGMEVLADIRHPLGTTDFSSYFPRILALKPDVLIVCNFGRDQQIAFKQANDFGIKKQMKIIAPLLMHNGRSVDGHKTYEGVIGGTGYYWGLEGSLASSKKFNDAFKALHKGVYPTDYAGLGYAGVRNVLAAAKFAGTTDTEKVVDALRAVKGDLYKGNVFFRQCDHQAVQSVLIIESKDRSAAANDQDIFRILATETFDESKLRSCNELGHQA
ncbi:ABC transporter substrate-binding protein [Noviherbaspirillum sp.]|uniref:ABC transporter substrate-binding protein n=1 Tax=Noviherbaspirillum sp. TaxID=1926288 RepID=UPI002B468124|nr:ABC transporter substrate-binding protein [Noviherbaspirillum sp.]HJV80053.1 ABC transporter substrate-binding protein [Noviherbaspirillum sp.]